MRKGTKGGEMHNCRWVQHQHPDRGVLHKQAAGRMHEMRST